MNQKELLNIVMDSRVNTRLLFVIIDSLFVFIGAVLFYVHT